jgi:hypothetical protein
VRRVKPGVKAFALSLGKAIDNPQHTDRERYNSPRVNEFPCIFQIEITARR